MSFDRLTPIDLAQAQSLLTQRGADEVRAQSQGYTLSGVWLAAGPWVMEGDLELPRAPYGGGLLIVDGDLTVGGFFRDTRADSTTFVAVLGNLRARDVSTADFLFVTKDFLVARTLYGNSSSNKALFVDGRFQADVLVLDGHSIECADVVARVAVDAASRSSHLEPPFEYGIDNMAKVVDPMLIGDDECLDADRVDDALRARKSLLITGEPSR